MPAMLAHVPAWVFAVLLLLLWLGFVQSRSRLVAPAVVLAVAAGLAVWSGWGVVSSFGLHAAVMASWGAGLVTAALLGRRLLAPAGMRFDAVARRVRVPGSWLPLAVMLGIFSLKFVVGAAAGMGTPVAPGSLAAAAVALSLGLFSGAFLARARAIHAVAR
jgi:hypothetical protein